MAKFSDRLKSGCALRLISSAYSYLLVSLFLLLVPAEGYSVIADFKFSLFLALSLSYVLLMAAAYIVMFFLGEKPDIKKYISPANIALLVYLALSVVSACLSPYKTETLLGGTRHDGLLTIFLYAATFLLMSRHFRPDRRFVCLSAASVTVFCVISLLQLEGLNPLSLYPNGFDYFGADIDYAGAYIGTLGNTNFAAPVLAGATAAFFSVIIRSRDPMRALLAVPAALSLYILIKIDVSSALLALILFLPLSLPVLSGNNKNLRRAAYIFIPLFFAAALLTLLFVRFENGVLYEASRFLRGEGEPHFGSGRLSIWTAALDAVKENPLFGTGPDTFRFLGLKFQQMGPDGTATFSYITAAHNDYLNILVNQGWLALTAYLIMLVTLAVKWYRSPENVASATAGSFALVFAVQLFFGISTPVHMPFFWLALAVLNICGKNTPQ